jgi:hypothetical protein
VQQHSKKRIIFIRYFVFRATVSDAVKLKAEHKTNTYYK